SPRHPLFRAISVRGCSPRASQSCATWKARMHRASASREMENTMNPRALLDKNAVVFGAGGSIGAAVAKEFAAEGVRSFLAGRTKASLEGVAKQITASGGEARTAVIDTSRRRQHKPIHRRRRETSR